MTKLGRYIRRNQHPYTVTVKNGKGRIAVLFYDGYITIRSHQPGLHHVQEIHITRKAWFRMLPQLVKVTRLMEGPTFDRYKAERRYYRAEELHQQELRAQKRERRGPRRRRRS